MLLVLFEILCIAGAPVILVMLLLLVVRCYCAIIAAPTIKARNTKSIVMSYRNTFIIHILCLTKWAAFLLLFYLPFDYVNMRYIYILYTVIDEIYIFLVLLGFVLKYLFYYRKHCSELKSFFSFFVIFALLNNLFFGLTLKALYIL